MRYKLLTLLCLIVLTVGLVNAVEESYIFKNGDDANLTIAVFNSDNSKADATVNCFLSIDKPLSRGQVLSDQQMTYTSTGFFNYTIPSTSLITNGDYPTTMRCDNGVSYGFTTFNILVTPNGIKSTTPNVLFYLGGLVVLVLFFVLGLIGLFKFEDYRGRFAFYWVCHLLFVAIVFICWDMSIEFLTSTTFVTGMFKIIFWVSTIAIFPMLILSFAWIFYIHLMNDTIKGFMNRGMTEDEAFERTHKKGRRGGGGEW